MQRQLTTGVGAHEVTVDLRLSVLKARHASCIVEIFDKFQSEKGVTIIMNEFRKAGVTETIEMVDFPEQVPI